MPRMVHRRGDKDSSDDSADSSSLSNEDWKKQSRTTKLSRFAGAICFVALFMVVTSISGKTASTDPTSVENLTRKSSFMEKTRTASKSDENLSSKTSFMDEYKAFEKAYEKYDNCVVSYEPPPAKSEWDTKPLWLTAYPGSGTTGPSGKGDLFKPLINSITGLKTGAKSFHASSKILKFCKGIDETVTCANGHPVVDIKPGKRKDKFYNKVILVVRNFKTMFPTHDSEKGEAYHDKTGQNDIDSWRKARDMWIRHVFDSWKGLLMTWKGMPEYEIGMYVQYEHMFDPELGPATVQRLADIFREAGFSVAPNEDLPCMWFQTVKEEYLRLKEYWKYTPGFTTEQRNEILTSLETFHKEVADDKELAEILKSYHNDMSVNTLIDIPAKKE